MPPVVPARSSNTPRLLLTPARIARVRAQRDANTALWQTFKANADRMVSKWNKTGYDINELYGMPILGLAYQVTNVAAYGQVLRDYHLALIADPVVSNISSPNALWWSDDTYYARFLKFVGAIGLDWAYDQYTLAQRSACAAYWMDYADWLWPETNRNSKMFAPDDPGWNYDQGDYQEWATALAYYGEAAGPYVAGNRYGQDVQPPDSNPTGSGANRPNYFYNLLYTKWTTEILPFLTTGVGAGGVFPESTGYGSGDVQRLFQTLECHRTCTGEDLINDPSNPWFGNAIRYMLSITTPDMKGRWPWGEQAHGWDYNDRHAMIIAGDCVNDATLRKWAKWWKDTVAGGAAGPSTSNSFARIWIDMLHDRSDEASEDYTQAGKLPLYYTAAGPNQAVRRSKWLNDQDTVMWGYSCGTEHYSHERESAGELMILAGATVDEGKDSMLRGAADNWAQSGGAPDTPYTNNLVRDYVNMTQYAAGNKPGGQAWTYFEIENQGLGAIKNEDATDYALREGQAKAPYNYRGLTASDVCRDYVSKVLCVGTDQRKFFVFKRWISPDGTHSLTDFIQSQAAPAVTGNQIEYNNGSFSGLNQYSGSYKARETVLLPAGVVIAQDSNTGLLSSGLKITLNPAPATSIWLTAIQLGRTASAWTETATLLTISGGMTGAMIGNWIGMFGTLAEVVSATIGYSFTNSQATEHVICDMPHLAPATVTVDGTPASYTTTALGTLRFSVPSGTHTISIVTSGGAAPGAPTGLSAVAGNASAALAWTDDAGATAANVYKRLSSGGADILVASGITGGAYTVTGLTNGTQYWFVVKDTNLNGEGAASNQATATPTGGAVPSAPTNLRAIAGDGYLDLAWDGTATTFNLYQGTTPGGEGGTPVVTLIGANSYRRTGLTNGQTKYFQVSGVNSNGEGTKSAEASGTPVGLSAPAAPQLLEEIEGDTTVTLTWYTELSAQTYSVEESPNGSTGWTVLRSGVTKPTITETGLTNGVTRYYRANATNNAGTGPYSNIVAATPHVPHKITGGNLVPNAFVRISVGEKRKLYGRVDVTTGTIQITGTAPTYSLFDKAGTVVAGHDTQPVTGYDTAAGSFVRAWKNLDTILPTALAVGYYTIVFEYQAIGSDGETCTYKPSIEIQVMAAA